MCYEEIDEIEYDPANLAGDFIYQGEGYYDEEGIWHDPKVEEE